MTLPASAGAMARRLFILFPLFLGACTSVSHEGKGMVRSIPMPPAEAETGAIPPEKVSEHDVEDLRVIPQKVEALPALAGVGIGETCGNQLIDEFERHFFAPWTSSAPIFDLAETKQFMRREANESWLGVNKRKVPHKTLQQILLNCALDSFPSRSHPAIAVAPGHLRGLPTPLPLYQLGEGAPFDMLSYPQLKLNEPLRVLHVSRDGAWYFVESPYSNGWIETRDVALVEPAFMNDWMRGRRVVVMRDQAPLPDGKGVATSLSKLGTVLPLVAENAECWKVKVASAGEGGIAEVREVAIPRGDAAIFPLPFSSENVALVGDRLLGQPYGWGELYDLRDCSALLRDLFLPFGIWLPRTSSDQIASTARRVSFNHKSASEREALIKSKGTPFLTLLYKPGHIMLYVGQDREGRPLVFHDSWSIRVKDGEGAKTQIIGLSAITTLWPGKELGLVPGWSLLERVTEMGSIGARCK